MAFAQLTHREESPRQKSTFADANEPRDWRIYADFAQTSIQVARHITHGKIHDVEVLDHIAPEPGSYVVMGRGYMDFARLYHLNQRSPASSFPPETTYSSSAAVRSPTTNPSVCEAIN
jgi:hypothetical protein